MSTGGERLDGIKAYKGTIESVEQTLSFLITFICEGEEMWESRNWVRGICTRKPKTLLSLQIYKKKEKE